MVALQREAERLAGEARTLVGDLRRLEVERDLQIERFNAARSAVTEAQDAVVVINGRLAELEQRRVSQLPDLKAQLVDLYKRGRGGYARLVLGASGIREFGRTTRAVSAIVRINEERVAEHRSTLEAMRGERLALETKLRELQSAEERARATRTAAERAVNARAALIAQIDRRRDLTAQFAGELQVASQRLQEQAASSGSGRPAGHVDVPLAPFRGALDWPVSGSVTGRFGQPSGRFGAPTARNGIEVAATEDTPVLAVHSGTVSYADTFTGFGNLVIVDHGGNNVSLYGYLSSTSVRMGDIVEAGSEVGRVGSAPGGPAALYFEIRIDGRPVDPVQWLKTRER
jgi:septal ring factor EnvC (AmiA/AmiB activator)